MNIYLENAGFFPNFRRLNRCCREFAVKDPVHFHLICPKGVTPLHLYFLTARNKAIATMTLHIPAKHLTGTLVRLCNASAPLRCVILVDRALTPGQWKRICKLNGIIRIVDTGDAPNEDLYRENRNVVYEKGDVNTIRLADIYHLTAADKSIYQCHYSSCLGKTLLIRRDGSVSFCPQHPEESKIGSVDQLEDIFESPVFYDTLSQAVQKRSRCKATCPDFEKCKGGCPFEDDCQAFRAAYGAARSDRDDIIARQADLSALPLYKELAVLRHLCDLSAPNNLGYQDHRS